MEGIMIALRFIGLTLLFTVLGVLAVLIDWLLVFGIIALGMRDNFAQLLLFLITGLVGPCWAGYATHAFVKTKCPGIDSQITWPAILGFSLVVLVVVGIYGSLTLLGFFYRGVRM